MQTTKLNIVYASAPSGQPEPALAQAVVPLLEVALAQAGAQGAYVYRLHQEEGALKLAAWKGLAPSDILRFQVQISGAKAEWHSSLESATVIDRGAWKDWRFQDFPEFVHHRFDAVAAVPLRDRGRVTGVVHFCRRPATAFSPSEAAFLLQLSQPLGTLLESTAVRAELEKVSRQLADRKTLDRAKGILQARFGWTEEEAYLYLRRNSRTRRTPLRDIASEVIGRASMAASENADAAD